MNFLKKCKEYYKNHNHIIVESPLTDEEYSKINSCCWMLVKKYNEYYLYYDLVYGTLSLYNDITNNISFADYLVSLDNYIGLDKGYFGLGNDFQLYKSI